MKTLEKIVAAISIFASGLIFGYYAEKRIEQPIQEIKKHSKTITIGECKVFVDSNNVLVNIECEQNKISSNLINFRK